MNRKVAIHLISSLPASALIHHSPATTNRKSAPLSPLLPILLYLFVDTTSTKQAQRKTPADRQAACQAAFANIRTNRYSRRSQSGAAWLRLQVKQKKLPAIAYS